jgi:pimeloyl-ACP methyl ester carboxylesterase
LFCPDDPVSAGHFFPEEQPAVTAGHIAAFLKSKGL